MQWTQQISSSWESGGRWRWSHSHRVRAGFSGTLSASLLYSSPPGHVTQESQHSSPGVSRGPWNTEDAREIRSECRNDGPTSSWGWFMGRTLPWPVSAVLSGDPLSRVHTPAERRALPSPLLHPFYPEHIGTRTAEPRLLSQASPAVALSSGEQTPPVSILVTLMLSRGTHKSNPPFTDEALSQDPCFLGQQCLHDPPTEKTEEKYNLLPRSRHIQPFPPAHSQLLRNTGLSMGS